MDLLANDFHGQPSGFQLPRGSQNQGVDSPQIRSPAPTNSQRNALVGTTEPAVDVALHCWQLRSSKRFAQLPATILFHLCQGIGRPFGSVLFRSDLVSLLIPLGPSRIPLTYVVRSRCQTHTPSLSRPAASPAVASPVRCST